LLQRSALIQNSAHTLLSIGAIKVGADVSLLVFMPLGIIYGTVWLHKLDRDITNAKASRAVPEELAVPQPRPHNAEGDNDLFIR
jgi:hypothetical protein